MDGSENGCPGRGLTIEWPIRGGLVGGVFERALGRGDRFWPKRELDVFRSHVIPVNIVAAAPGHWADVSAGDAFRTFHPARHHLQVAVAIASGMKSAHWNAQNFTKR